MLEARDLQDIRAIIKEEITNSESLVLREIDRSKEGMDKQLEQLTKNVEDLRQYYKITQLEVDNTALLMQMILDLKKELDELRSKIA